MRYLLSFILALTLSAAVAAEPREEDAARIKRLFVSSDKGDEWCATCFYVSETWLMTAAHTFKHGSHPFIVVDGQRFPVKVIQIDFKEDMCLLETSIASPTFFQLQRNGKLRTVGFPGETKVLTETTGTSNAKELSSSNQIYKGMSGGPTVNESDQVVGMGVRSDPFKSNRCYSVTSDKMIQFIETARKAGK